MPADWSSSYVRVLMVGWCQIALFRWVGWIGSHWRGSGHVPDISSGDANEGARCFASTPESGQNLHRFLRIEIYYSIFLSQPSSLDVRSLVVIGAMKVEHVLAVYCDSIVVAAIKDRGGAEEAKVMTIMPANGTEGTACR